MGRVWFDTPGFDKQDSFEPVGVAMKRGIRTPLLTFGPGEQLERVVAPPALARVDAMPELPR
jgi:hypothetical protein